MNDKLQKRMEDAISSIFEWPSKVINLFHHNDTDGLTSGAILKRSFERKGYIVRNIALEKPYPALLNKIFEMKNQIIVFADFAGRIAPIISQLNNSRNLVVILDHHEAEPSLDKNVINCDPELFGLKGDRDITASTTCYLFSTLMDHKNIDLVQIAAIGAVGDEFFVNGEVYGENLKIVEDAVDQGLIKIDPGKKEGERYIFITNRGELTGKWIEDYLDTLGGVGFYQNGPNMGIKVCLDGFSEDSDRMVADLKAIKDKRFNHEIKRLKNGEILKTKNIQWFHVEDRFKPMGVKMIGVFCDAIKKMDFISSDKYIAGFQIIPNEVPGFGKIDINQVKISMRVPPPMEEEIRSSRRMGLNRLLPEATEKLGGFSDACHSLTAATTIDVGKEKQLIEEMEAILQATN